MKKQYNNLVDFLNTHEVKPGHKLMGGLKARRDKEYAHSVPGEEYAPLWETDYCFVIEEIREIMRTIKEKYIRVDRIAEDKLEMYEHDCQFLEPTIHTQSKPRDWDPLNTCTDIFDALLSRYPNKPEGGLKEISESYKSGYIEFDKRIDSEALVLIGKFKRFCKQKHRK